MADPTEDPMNLCFICNEKLIVGYTQLASCTLPYSHVTYLERVAELLGEGFVLIVNSADNMCLKCTSLLNHMDKLERDMEHVKKIIKSDIQKKYYPEQVVKRTETVEMLNEQTANKRLKTCQIKVQTDSSTIKTLTVGIPPGKKTEQIQMHQQNNANRLGSVRRVQLFRTLTRSNNKELERPVSNPTAAVKISTPIPTPRYIHPCQLCSKSFSSRLQFLLHHKKDHQSSWLRSPYLPPDTRVRFDVAVKESIKLPDPEDEKGINLEDEDLEGEEEKEAEQSEASNNTINEAIRNLPINIEDITIDPSIKRVFFFT